MRNKPSPEFEQFDKVIGGLLVVPYAELQQKLEEEKQAKAQKKRRATSSPKEAREGSA